MNFLKKIYEKLVYIEEYDPNYNRRWKRQINLRNWKGKRHRRIDLSYDIVMTIWDGKINEKPWHCSSLSLGFTYDPRLWKIDFFHSYYDGPNCSYQVGPFWFQNSSHYWCKKCYPGE